jgi:hypothetical protein
MFSKALNSKEFDTFDSLHNNVEKTLQIKDNAI